MPQVTIVYGLALIALGVIGYLASGGASVTALIPVFLGVLAVIAGWLARNERLLKHAMHAAAVLGVIGVLGGAPGLFALLGGEPADAGSLSRATLAVLSAIFVGLCVRSFIQARKAREAAG